mmetsp:Transcript_22290/g.22594  ORF Transcript_22290/g.22594 Transcript_22290/m.22594 type:complete len:279 (+) Transcript_22290:1465-2301(+)
MIIHSIRIVTRHIVVVIRMISFRPLPLSLLLLMPFKRGRPFERIGPPSSTHGPLTHRSPIWHSSTAPHHSNIFTISASSLVTPIDNPSPHFLWSFTSLLRKHNLQLPSLHRKLIHFVPRLTRLAVRSKFDKGKPFRLLAMIISWDIHITYLPDTTERSLKIIRGDIRRNIAHQERYTRRMGGIVALIASATLAAAIAAFRATVSHRRPSATLRWHTTHDSTVACGTVAPIAVCTTVVWRRAIESTIEGRHWSATPTTSKWWSIAVSTKVTSASTSTSK